MRKGIRIGSVLRRVALATALALAPAAAQDDWSEFDDFEEEFEEFEEEADEPEAQEEPAPPSGEGEGGGEGTGDPFAQAPPDVPGAPEGDEAKAPGDEGEEEEPREIDVGGIPVEIAPRTGEDDEPEVAEDEEPEGVEVPIGGVWDHDETHGFDERGGDRIPTHEIAK